jgi:hypothetical protein
MLVLRSLTFLCLVLLLSGCSSAGPEAMPPPAAADKEIVARMIEAHGGLAKWRASPTVSFTDSFTRAGEPSGEDSQVTVEQRTRRAYLDFPQAGAQIVWDGEKAWSQNWKAGPPPRFVALLSYYFLNLPWLAADPGVNLSAPGRGRLGDDPTEYLTVKMTFAPGVGDTPDDYYLLFIDPKTYRLRGSEFTVTYAALLPPDVKEIKEFIVFDDFTHVDGLLVPGTGVIYKEDGALAGTFRWREVSFSKPFDEARMQKPAGAVIDTSNATLPSETAVP